MVKSPTNTRRRIMGRIIRNIIFWLLLTFNHVEDSHNILRDFVILFPLLIISFGIPGYINNFFLIPKYYVKRRQAWYFFLFLVLLAITSIGSYYSTKWINATVEGIDYMGSLKDVGIGYHAFPSMFVMGMLMGGKFAADAVSNQRQLESLETQKLASELESLKSQVNPHFIFNALNTIYGLSRKTSPAAAEAVIELSDILRYILYECGGEYIFVSSELNFLKQYVDFAKLRARPSARINFSIQHQESDQRIAPLLLLPLLENAMKHGLSKQIENPWVEAKIEVNDNLLVFDCANSNYEKTNQSVNPSSGIGLKNVLRRLELIYPDKHEIIIDERDNIYRVKLRLTLI